LLGGQWNIQCQRFAGHYALPLLLCFTAQLRQMTFSKTIF
jgi:hypothetical protein